MSLKKLQNQLDSKHLLSTKHWGRQNFMTCQTRCFSIATSLSSISTPTNLLNFNSWQGVLVLKKNKTKKHHHQVLSSIIDEFSQAFFITGSGMQQQLLGFAGVWLVLVQPEPQVFFSGWLEKSGEKSQEKWPLEKTMSNSLFHPICAAKAKHKIWKPPMLSDWTQVHGGRDTPSQGFGCYVWVVSYAWCAWSAWSLRWSPWCICGSAYGR